LLFQVFAGNAAVFIVALLLLVVTPITIHAPITLRELAFVFAGLLLLLTADLILLRRALGPLRRLAETMHAVDPAQPRKGRVHRVRLPDRLHVSLLEPRGTCVMQGALT